ncbi:hypothetical protein ACLOJK_003903 [Asimina triloba]
MGRVFCSKHPTMFQQQFFARASNINNMTIDNQQNSFSISTTAASRIQNSKQIFKSQKPFKAMDGSNLQIHWAASSNVGGKQRITNFSALATNIHNRAINEPATRATVITSKQSIIHCSSLIRGQQGERAAAVGLVGGSRNLEGKEGAVNSWVAAVDGYALCYVAESRDGYTEFFLISHAEGATS